MSDELPSFPMPRTSPWSPPEALTALGESAPVHRVRIWDGTTPWLVTGYAEQRAVLASRALSSDPSRPGMPHVTEAASLPAHQSKSMINMDDPEHGRHRRMLVREFTVRRVDSLRPVFQSIADQALEAVLAKGPPSDLVLDFAEPLALRALCELLGLPVEDRPFYESCIELISSASASAEESEAAAVRLRAHLDHLVGQRAEEPGDDLVSRLVREQLNTGSLSRPHLTDMVDLLLVAGYGTTVSAIALGVALLTQHPDQFARLVESDDPALFASAADETLRYATVMHLGRRRVATADLVVGDVLIREGEGLILANDAGNRDGAVFPDPDRFDVGRAPRHHLGFGYGPHQCLGHTMARAELQIAFRTLARRMPTLRLAVPFDEIRFKNEMVVYGVHALPVTW